MNRLQIIITALFVAGLIALLWASASARRQDSQYASHTRQIMVTPVTVVAPEPVAAKAAEIVFAAFAEVDAMMSEWKPESPLSAVNRAAGSHPVAVPDDLRRVIRRGIEIGELTDGAFDLTWAALWGLWDFKAELPRLPDEDERRRRTELVDYRRIVIDEDGKTVYLPQSGQMIGLGGIAKGTALNRAADALRAAGIESFLISAGGQVYAGGRRGDRPWRIGIRDPRGEGSEDFFAHIELTDAGSATSGDYERFFIIDGVRYHHILDPRTGMPARGSRCATVIAADAELADALSTAMMILDPSRAMILAEQLDDVELVLVDADGAVHVSSGLEGRLQFQR